MFKTTYSVLGVMSGTSLDGIDVAELQFKVSEEGKWTFKIVTSETVAYPLTWVAILKEAVHFSEGRLKTLNEKYTRYLAQIIREFIAKNAIKNLDAVCSHGHTILHNPDQGITLQIGNLPEISTLSNETVVCDFRVQDVSLGGQGAPLVPIGDQLLFSEYDYCLNLGGFANCSSEVDGVRIAYDICPVNIVLNSLSEVLGLPYDDGGTIARNGLVDKSLLTQLNNLPFYSLSPPKSLGLEWVQAHVFPLLNASEISAENKIATFTEHIAQQLAAQFAIGSTVLVTGGGAYNTYLLEQMMAHKKLQLVVPEKRLVEFKEALIFGLLGVLRLRNEVNCLASVTGASHNHSTGVIFKTI
ncbi:anhydro-N-acetylmuramic acid kinase [Rasiella rasia]|uniref:Anhydro-N-acetylmuramic acid kinase n=1 Tax=Rasiella rasia TaxID=2744027 RepID=A0A6G6GP10_9FLAO|nr:anhydro-N-acetylmuramic acid kinase [Rasiella rasia]QIE60316.1 anhydro-N-acetylmuramic acid kinase [Rasiella rasia]